MAGALAALVLLVGGSAAAPQSAAAKPWLPTIEGGSVLWAVGDGADGGAEGRDLGRMLGLTRLDRFLYLGDVYETGTARDFATKYAPAFGGLASRTAPVIGNHESAQRNAGFMPYWRSVRGRAPSPWYTISASGWQLIGLDTNSSAEPGSPQLGWLKRKLRRTPGYGDCRIAFMHHPRFSAGMHGDNEEVAPIWSALSGRASLAIGGHDHDYQRLLPISGLTQLVVGTGGRASYQVKADSRLAFSDDKHTGAVRVRLRGRQAFISFVGLDGMVYDHTIVRCHRPGSKS